MLPLEFWFCRPAGELIEPPKRSRWLSCANATRIGPCSHLTPQDTTRGSRFGLIVWDVPTAVVSLSLGLPREYCTLVCSPPRMVGDVKSSAFGRRRLKLDAEFVPKPTFCSTLLCDTKLPLLTPRKPRILPYSLYGVSIFPMRTVPHPSLAKPTNEFRLPKVEIKPAVFAFTTPSSRGTVCSNCQIPFVPRPTSLLPRKPT